MTAIFADGGDLHTATAVEMTGLPPDQAVAYRDAAKITNFSTLYRAGPRTIAENAFADYGLEVSEAGARAWRDSVHRAYPELNAGLEDHARECQARGYIAIGNRIIRAEWEIETRGYLTAPQCANAPIQGLGADCMTRTLVLLDRRLAGLECRIVAIVHDEILLEVRADQAEAAAAILKATMIEMFEASFPGAPGGEAVVKVGIGKTWKSAK